MTRLRRPFKSDGCSGGMTTLWRLFLRRDPPWEGCCVDHDLQYWFGGTKRERFSADVALMECVAAQGHRNWAVLMFLAVRIGGSPYWPLPWRWNYGSQYSARYTQEIESDTDRA
jgi:hypothetical protein